MIGLIIPTLKLEISLSISEGEGRSNNIIVIKQGREINEYCG